MAAEQITITVELRPRWLRPVALWVGTAVYLIGLERLASQIILLGYRLVKV